MQLLCSTNDKKNSTEILCFIWFPKCKLKVVFYIVTYFDQKYVLVFNFPRFFDIFTKLINELYCSQHPNLTLKTSHTIFSLVSEVNSAQNLHQFRLRLVLVPSIIVILLLVLTTTLAIFKDYLFVQTFVFRPVNPNTSVYIDDHPVYFRDNWGGLEKTEYAPFNVTPIPLVIISHTATELCYTFLECSNITQMLQFNNLKSGQTDITYNFLIGDEGGIYIGRGWDKQNSLRVDSVAVAFIGDFNKDVPDSKALEAGKALITEGVNLGMIAADYELIGENQTSALRFYSPGRNLMAVIKSWDHYFPGTKL